MNGTTDNSRATISTLKIVGTIAAIGAINWGLIGFFNFNLVDAIFGGGSAEQTSAASRVIYSLVGIAGVITLVLLLPLHRVTDTRTQRPLQEQQTLT